MALRRRATVSAENTTPTNIKPGELLFDEDGAKLYAGLSNGTAIQITGSGGVSLTSDTSGIAGATAVTNIVKISQTAYDALPVKNPTTVYIIDNNYLVAE